MLCLFSLAEKKGGSCPDDDIPSYLNGGCRVLKKDGGFMSYI